MFGTEVPFSRSFAELRGFVTAHAKGFRVNRKRKVHMKPIPRSFSKALAMTVLLAGAASLKTHAAATVQTLNAAGVTASSLANSAVDTTTITISSPAFTGDNDAGGLFSGGIAVGLGIDAGIILSTGNANDGTQSNIVPDDSNDISTSWGNSGDSDLDRLIPGSGTADVASLTFNFTPTYSDLKLEMVFASEEYNEWIGRFNDIGAVFIKYPGETEWVNINCPEVVSVNSINSDNNSCLYINNTTPLPAAQIGMAYDGFTRKLTIHVPVVAGQAHSMKIAIGDVGDTVLDSAMFIKQDSIKTAAFAHTPGTVDSSFAPSSGANAAVYAATEQPDGKVVIGGDFTTVNGSTRNYLARLNSDGTVDGSSYWFYLSLNGPVYAVALQPDGKILIGGDFTQVYSYPSWVVRNKMARLNADGSLDTTFSNPYLNGRVRSIAVLSDGSVAVGGEFVSNSPYSPNYIAHYSASGSMLWSPSSISGANGIVYAVAEDPTGAGILFGGAFTAINGTTANRLARLDSSGTVDASYDTSVGANNTVYSIATQHSRTLIGGAFTSYAGSTRTRVARLLPDATLDPTFDPGTGPNGTVRTINTDNCNEIYIGGDFTSVNSSTRNRIAALLPSGKEADSFNPGTGANSTVYALDVAATGSLTVGGAFTTYDSASRSRIARAYLSQAISAGDLDTAFAPSSGANGPVNAVAEQADGKVVIGGSFTSVNGTTRNYIARLNADGTLDSSSYWYYLSLDGPVYAVTIQPDGKVLIGGDFTQVYSSPNWVVRNKMARLNSNGSLDTTFSNPYLNGRVRSIALGSDGSVNAGGEFVSNSPYSPNYIARYSASGAMQWAPGTIPGANGIVYSVLVDRNDNVLFGGAFTSINGTTINRIARLDTSGNVDASFTPGTAANNTIYSMSLLDDGRIAIGGAFTSYNGTTRTRVGRLNGDGTLDTTFNAGSGANLTVYSVLAQGVGHDCDQKLVVAGSFTSFNGTSLNRIIRLNEDGSRDATFKIGTGFNGDVNALGLTRNRDLYGGGAFTTYNSVTRNRIVRILGE